MAHLGNTVVNGALRVLGGEYVDTINGVEVGDSPKFTDNDTKNTAGSTDSSSKLFLIGATSQAANPQTYSHDTAYVGTDGCLYSGGTKVLTGHQTIKQDGVTGATVNRFGTCSTAAATAAKEVSITTGTFALEAGSIVAVKFSNANTANSPTLNVNSKGAKNIFVNGAQITSGGNKALLTGTVIFIYDGTQWHLIGNYYDTNTQAVTGVKGNSESSYRTGNVNITAANVGAATSDHTHTTTIAADSGTSALNMAANTTYKLTAGGSTFIFKTPADGNTDTKVTQTATSTSANYEILFSATADNTTRTEAAGKNSNLLFNPSTGAFYAEGFNRVDITGQTLDLNTLTLKETGSPHAKYYIERTDGGAANITNRPVTENKPFLLDVEAIRVNTASDFITRQTYRNAANPANEYVRFCTNGTWGAWTTRVFTDTTYSVVSSSANGLAPKVTDTSKFLKGDGTWATPTDTKNTAGSTDSSSKLFLIGATSQAANPQTYSHDTAYVGTDGCLYSGGTKVLTAHQDISGKVNKSGDTMTGRLTTTKPINQIITGTGTAAQDKGSGVSPRYFPAKWTFNTGQTLTNGDILTIKIPVAGHDYGVFISIDNGTTYKPISISGTSRLTTHFGNASYLTLIYKSDGGTNNVYAAAGADARSNITGGAWMVLNFYDTGNTYDRNRFNANIKAWGTKIVAGNIIVGKDGVYHHLKQGTAFDISYPILYLNGDCNANATTTNTYDILNFTITTTQSITLTAYKPVYIKGTLSGTTFTPDSTTPLTQTVPTSADGKYYMFLGNATSTTAVYLTERHEIYAYKNGAFGRIVNDALSVNGYTVAKSVPSNAVFTDNNNAVTQTATTTSADYEVLFSATADNTTRTEGSRKNSNLKFNPSTGNLTVTKVNGEAVKYSSSVSAAVGDTTCTISDSAITTTSMLEPFCSNTSGNIIAITNMTATAGQAVLTFDALEEATDFKLRISNI